MCNNSIIFKCTINYDVIVDVQDNRDETSSAVNERERKNNDARISSKTATAETETLCTI